MQLRGRRLLCVLTELALQAGAGEGGLGGGGSNEASLRRGRGR